MFGAIYIGLSGLNAHSRGLQQVSNNVTNLNTIGFKGSTVSFQNFYGSGDRGGLSYTVDGGAGGNGVGMANQRLDLKQGEMRQTDRDLDLAVDGTGFLVLLKGDEVLYTRTGNFEVDKDGFVVLSGTQYRLATLDASGRPVSLSIDGKRTNPPLKTSSIKFTENLSLGSETHTISGLKVYDEQGTQYLWKVQFTRVAGSGSNWTVKVTDDKGTAFTDQTLKFTTGGSVDPTTAALTFVGAGGLSVSLNFSGAESFSGGTSSTMSVSKIDGHGVGAITAIAVNEAGELEIGYSNEQKTSLGAIALGDFRDPQGLEQRSGGLFAYEGSGQRTFLASTDPRVGQVLGKRLEASNVDLSKQFGDLILIQRGFQASSQIVSISNDMIQQLFGIRGQG